MEDERGVPFNFIAGMAANKLRSSRAAKQNFNAILRQAPTIDMIALLNDGVGDLVAESRIGFNIVMKLAILGLLSRREPTPVSDDNQNTSSNMHGSYVTIHFFNAKCTDCARI